jgi:hypothetical protein
VAAGSSGASVRQQRLQVPLAAREREQQAHARQGKESARTSKAEAAEEAANS